MTIPTAAPNETLPERATRLADEACGILTTASEKLFAERPSEDDIDIAALQTLHGVGTSLASIATSLAVLATRPA